MPWHLKLLLRLRLWHMDFMTYTGLDRYYQRDAQGNLVYDDDMPRLTPPATHRLVVASSPRRFAPAFDARPDDK